MIGKIAAGELSFNSKTIINCSMVNDGLIYKCRHFTNPLHQVEFCELNTDNNIAMRKLLLVLFGFPLLTNAQTNYAPALAQYMSAQVKEFEFSGDVLVAQKGQVIFKKAFGLADREWNVPNTTETKFKIGSITKQFTAAAILQLVQT